MPTTKITFDGRSPEEAWAEIREPRDVPESKRRATIDLVGKVLPFQNDVQALQALVNGGAENLAPLALDPAKAVEMIEIVSAVGDAVILAFVKAWPWGEVSREVLLDEVPGDVYAELRQRLLPLFGEIAPKFDVDSAVIGTTEGGAPIVDRGSPTQP